MRSTGPHSAVVQLLAQGTQSVLALLAVLVALLLLSPTFRRHASRAVLVGGLVFVTVLVPATLIGLGQLRPARPAATAATSRGAPS